MCPPCAFEIHCIYLCHILGLWRTRRSCRSPEYSYYRIVLLGQTPTHTSMKSCSSGPVIDAGRSFLKRKTGPALSLFPAHKPNVVHSLLKWRRGREWPTSGEGEGKGGKRTNLLMVLRCLTLDPDEKICEKLAFCDSTSTLTASRIKCKSCTLCLCSIWPAWMSNFKKSEMWDGEFPRF